MKLIYGLKLDESTDKTGHKGFGESVTDRSGFRPEIATTRDQIIAINNGTGGGYKGKYDSDLQLDNDTELALAYARRKDIDIAEVEGAKKYVENKIKNDKEENKNKELNKKTSEKVINALETIANNTTTKDKPED